MRQIGRVATKMSILQIRAELRSFTVRICPKHARARYGTKVLCAHQSSICVCVCLLIEKGKKLKKYEHTSKMESVRRSGRAAKPTRPILL